MANQPLTVSLIQSTLAWEDADANLRHFEEKIDSIGERTELIVLPEMFSTGFSMSPEKLAETMDGKTVNWMKRVAHKKQAVITGSVIINDEGHYYNRLIWMLPNGQYGYYNKRHLFSYADEHNHYSPGDKKLTGSLKGWKINLQVCYDLRFPVWNRQPPEKENRYDILINVASWPDKRRTMWRTLLTARAIENQCFVIGVNRVGIDGNGHGYAGDSLIIDPLGNILVDLGSDEKIVTHTFHKEDMEKVRSHFPFLEDADNYLIML
ncbi:MAG: amidohydrolase [Chitinophagaceae bacterium]|nr:amidohydrolase [Chitinophagaceae bacterium]